MQIVIRTYYGKGTKQLFDLLEKNQTKVQQLMRTVEGLVSYTLARDQRGGVSVTVCRDQRGIRQSVQVARTFIAEHYPQLSLAAMQITEGKVILHVH